MRVRTWFQVTILWLALPLPLLMADVRLPALFTESVVLQRDIPIPVWGWADAGESVTVTLGDASATVIASRDGTWRAELPPAHAGGPHTLVVTGHNTISIEDVWLGEVWLCSGQSNMAMTVSRAQDFAQEQARSDVPLIRQFKVGSRHSSQPEADCTGQWTICQPETVGQFSATAYFFAREVHQALDVPVGLIVSAVGGTPIDSWVPEADQRAAEGLSEFLAARDTAVAEFDEIQARQRYEKQLTAWQAEVKRAREAGDALPKRPQDPVDLFHRKQDIGGLYNGMIAPVLPYAFRGVLWYQGEANSVPEKAALYRHQLPLLVTSWRREHGGDPFPVAWVQLPNFLGTGRNWPLVREAMLETLALPQTGMAVTLDVGDPRDIHPKNKQEVGRRLAVWALADVYQQSGPASGPRYAGFDIAGGRVEIRFSHAADGLVLKPPAGRLDGFAIAGADRVWHPATVEVKGDRLLVTSAQVSAPRAVRYAWANNPPTLLHGMTGLPASPFRTDDWDDVQPFEVD